MIEPAHFWLEKRRARAVVEDEFSEEAVYENTVFQVIMLGPPLWNLFFQDARRATQEAAFEEVLYADDLNAFKVFDKSLGNDEILEACKLCRANLHDRGLSERCDV